MKSFASIYRKELRSYFLSPIALIFLGVFLVAVLFAFFTSTRFFARNIADVRPLFEWLPLLLIFLVAAITMRSWSEEQKLGTIEVLLTLPVKTKDLVLGKLAAGVSLVVLALALTLPLAITVSFLGDLDWGPVFGGYLGGLLLATAYMSIGMCVSSRTDNQVVSLMVTSLVCGLFLLVGSDTIAGFFGTRASELLRSIGSGSRFVSIERGVLDLRDLVYYASVSLFFVVLNVHFLDMKRRDVSTESGRQRAGKRWLAVGLAGLNLVAVNLWLAPITWARADLTQGGVYSISDVTEKIIGGLREPLYISGYFSEKTHPLLAPLIPRIRDMLSEYEIYGHGKVRISYADPNKDEQLRKDISEQYNINSLPFRVSERHEESVVNSYFHLLLRYGDQYQVLSFDDLIEVFADENRVDVRLRNMEYDLTRAIKKLTQGFQSIDSLFAQLDAPAKLTAYITPNALPDEFKDAPERIRKAAKELSDKSAGKFSFTEVDPTGNESLQQDLVQKYGFRPLSVDLFGEKRYYLYLLLQIGSRLERVFPQGELTEAAIKSEIENGIKRGTPGFLKTVGLLTENPPPREMVPGLPPQYQQPQQQPDYRNLQNTLAEEFTVKRLEAKEGFIPNDIDVLIVAKPGVLDEKQQFAIDQYLMRGGAMIALAGAYEIKADQSGLQATKTDPSIIALLEKYGVTVDSGFVLDEQNARFPVPVQEQKGPFMMRRIKMMNYPFFPDIRRDSFSKGNVAVSGLQNVVLNWGSGLKLGKEIKDVKGEAVLSTSPRAWSYDSTQVLPATFQDADTAFPPTGKQQSYPVAVTLIGRFKSYFADKPSPLFSGAPQKPADLQKSEDRTGRTIKEAPSEARLAVVGSSAFASDQIAYMSGQMGGGVYRGNFQLVRNLVDWALADTDLLKIRNAGAFARTLKPMSEQERNGWEIGNYVFALAALAAVVLVASARRRRVKPIVATEVKA